MFDPDHLLIEETGEQIKRIIDGLRAVAKESDLKKSEVLENAVIEEVTIFATSVFVGVQRIAVAMERLADIQAELLNIKKSTSR